MRKILLLCVIGLSSVPLLAQQSVAEAAAKTRAARQGFPPDAPTREDVLKLFDLLQVQRTMDAVLEAAQKQANAMAEQMLREKMPDATPEQRQSFHKYMNDTMQAVFGSLPVQELLEDTIPVYQRHLTKSDIEAVIEFYSSPVGQKLLREQPQMIRESVEAMAGTQQRLVSTMMKKVEQHVKEMNQAAPGR